MFEYQKASRSQSSACQRPRQCSTGPSTASGKSQAAGLAYIRALKADLQCSASQIQAGPQSSSNPLQGQSDTRDTSEATQEAQTGAGAEALADEKDRIAVADELQRYIEEGVLDEAEYGDFSLTRYWQVRFLFYFEKKSG